MICINFTYAEPGILVMYHSLKTYPHITSTLLEFLLTVSKLIAIIYYIYHKDKI